MTTHQPVARSRTLKTMDEVHGRDAVYWGEHGEWLVVATQHRESDTLTRSNFRVLASQLAGTTVTNERSSHWAVGWIERLIVAPTDRTALRIALAAHSSLDDYPVLDEQDWSALEHDEFWDFARGELDERDGWEAAVEDVLANNDSGPGDEHAEWDMIQAAREALDAFDVMVGQSCLISP